ncbi:carbohydrate-binding protein [Methanosphaerula subterraneus]|uniref:carbohydrate-binding protein n=1 Tax=Methanosphaerula subterraneus TaxID=3350244 RepID=UPI003F841F8A
MKTSIFWYLVCGLLLAGSVQVASAEEGYMNNSTPADMVGGDGRFSGAGDVAVDSADTVATTTPAVTREPYFPYNGTHSVPGTVQAEDYDYGFEGSAYHDTTPGNQGGAYRQDDVDIETGASGYDIGWIQAGEYLTYTVEAAAYGDYTIALRASNPDAAAKTVTVSSRHFDNNNPPITVSVSSTGSFDTYDTFTSAGTLYLREGKNIVTVAFGASRMNLDSITFGNDAVQPLQAAFTVNTETVPAGQPVIGTDGSTGYPVSWIWNCGDGTTASNRKIIHQYRAPGSYTMSLAVRNGSRTSTVSRTITVTPGLLTADFEVGTTPGSTMVWIIDKSGNATTVRYDLGDGVASRNIPANGPHLIYYYSVAGTYTITQTATGATGETATRQVNVTVRSVPVTPDVTPYTPSTIVEAEDYEHGGEGVAYHDTTPGNEGGAYRTDDVDIVNTSDGGYAVSLIEPGEWLAYTIDNTGTTPLNLIVDFHVASTKEGGAILVEVDGTVVETVGVPDTGSLSDFETVFTDFIISEAPQHIIRLRFNGDSMSLDKIVIFWNRKVGTYADGWAVANFTQDTVNGTAPQTVHFTDTSLDEQYISKWHWTFGDGATSEEQHPTHTYLQPGVYTASLSLEGISHYFESIGYQDQIGLGWLQIWGGDNGKKSQTITITGAPAATPVANCTVTLVGGREIQITDTSVNATSVRYDLGDGTITDLTGFRYTYWQSGIYTITLTATNAAGSSVKKVQVYAPAVPPVTPSIVIGSPYIPGILQAEDYDLGGEGVAYHDTTPGNEGGAYRQDDVDIETANGVTDVGWIRDGEWLTYTVSVTRAGTYNLAASVASPNDGRMVAISVDGVKKVGLSVWNTGSFEAFRTTSTLVMLPAGTHTLTLTFQGDGQNLDWVELTPFVPPTPTTPMPDGST